jgi:hypothetical protein
MTTTLGHPSPAPLQVRFSLQNRYADDRFANDLAEIGVSNRAVTISGRATISGKGITLEEFLAAKPSAISATFKRFLAEHKLPRANDLVILDMEPTGFAPRALGEYEGRQQRDLIAAYRRRIRVAREVLQATQEPGLRVGLYQVIVPDGRGETTKEFERRMCGYVEAGRQGMFDELDFICPVLYQRFGTDDTAPETLRKWVVAATRQGIEGTRALTDRNDATIPLVPILSFWVFNGRSANNRHAVSPDLVARQLGVVHDAVGVAAAVFWSGWQTAKEMESANKPVQPIDIIEFLRSVGTSPHPSSTPTAMVSESGLVVAAHGRS